ncbi:branched-chain amino acid transport system II carrier protein [Bacillus tianshenii]|nr:branched-chain amino acid transport system II carrier protein [Bacillus tianshenii]
MKQERLSYKTLILVSLMLFSMFFGAGNLIFPAYLGYSAGENVWLSLAGFITSAVGFPILGVMAVAKAKSFHNLASRVHPMFALLFPLIIYISIGPALAIPRASTIAYEMGMKPFLSNGNQSFYLFLYTLVFFGIVLWFSLTPSKLVDRFGKMLTPVVLSLIAIVFFKSMLGASTSFNAPSGSYITNPLFQGVLDGYLTMDALAALVFGIVIANALRSKGLNDEKQLSTYMVGAGVGAGILLAVIYGMLAYLGASRGIEVPVDNGAQVLTILMNQLFGQAGVMILGLLFTLACLCVSIGLVISCSQYFGKLVPFISYKGWAFIISGLSVLTSNLGLNQILSVSVPILSTIYPMAIALIILGLIHNTIKRFPFTYITTVLAAGLFSLLEMINKTFLSNSWDSFLSVMPLYQEGAGWVVPALIGFVVGVLISLVLPHSRNKLHKEQAA